MGWIDVNDRLPKVKEFVVCLLKYEKRTPLMPRVGWLKDGYNIVKGKEEPYWVVPHSNGEIEEMGQWKVKYWMSLPKFPNNN